MRVMKAIGNEVHISREGVVLLYGLEDGEVVRSRDVECLFGSSTSSGREGKSLDWDDSRRTWIWRGEDGSWSKVLNSSTGRHLLSKCASIGTSVVSSPGGRA